MCNDVYHWHLRRKKCNLYPLQIEFSFIQSESLDLTRAPRATTVSWRP